MTALRKVLKPQVLTRVVSQQAAASSWLLNMFGCQPGGGSEQSLGHGREGKYHIFNRVRKVAKLTAPGRAANRRPANPMGATPFIYPRMHDSVSMNAEEIHNIGRIDDPQRRDVMGEQYVARQTEYLADLAANFRKVMLAGQLRGSLYMIPDNDAYYLDFAAGNDPSINIMSQMPAGNKGQLDMLGAGNIINASWATTTTDIPNQLGQINAAFQRLCGGYLAAVIVPWKQWNNIINNEHVAAIHGSANPPFTMMKQEALNEAVGDTMLNVHAAKLSAFPTPTFYITDEGFELGIEGGEQWRQLVDDDNAIFVGHTPSSDVISAYLGSEPIAEFDGAPKTVRTGLESWSVERSNPTETEIFALDNALIVNHVPNSNAYGTVEF